MRNGFFVMLTAFSLGCAASAINAPIDAAESLSQGLGAVEWERANADISPRLISLLDERKLERARAADFGQTALNDLIRLTTPAGYRLKNRYLEIGVPLAQALAASQDVPVRQRLVESARWTNSPRVRSESLIALAALKEPDHLKFLREAMLDTNVNVQFAAMEGLQIAGQTQAVPMFLSMADSTWMPFIRVYAAQAALRLGDSRGRDKLIAFLTNSDWLMRAMSARYLGDLGKPEDADLLLNRIGPEQENPFVLAEVCSAALKLISRKDPSASAPPPPPSADSSLRPTAATRRSASVLELEPLVITAPRLRFSQSQFVDVRIDNSLVQLLQKVAEMPLPEAVVLDAAREQLKDLVTPSGFSLKLRYNDLSFLVTQGLAGTRDFGLIQQLERIARDNRDARVRGAALISLAYEPDRRDTFIFRDALRDENVNVRFAAVESLGIMKATALMGTLADVAEIDRSMALRVYASEILARMGDAQGRDRLWRHAKDSDWVVRAMSIRALGDLAPADDYFRLQTQLNSEDNPFVVSEICLAMLKMASR